MRRSFFDFGVVVACALLALGLVVLLSWQAPEPALAPFDSRHLARMRSTRPHVVLMGNSMVYTRFDARRLNELVKPTRALVLAVGGSKAAVWYALIKHSVVASGVRPRRLVLFFRGKEIVQLTKYGQDISLARSIDGHDPVIERMLGTKAGKSKGLAGAFAFVAPVERLRSSSWEGVDALAMRFSAALADGPPGERRKKRINRLFGVDLLRPEPANADEQPEAFEDDTEELEGDSQEQPGASKRSSSSIETSLLPEILALTKENGIALTLAHVRTRRHAAGVPDSPRGARFIRALREYVERHGATYLDLTQNEWETLDYYGRGDHTAPRRRRDFTRRFVREYPELFAVDP